MPLGFGNRDPRIAVCRVRPAAAEIDRVAGSRDRPSAATEPRASLDDQAIDTRVMQAPGGGDADYRYLGFAFRHRRRSAPPALLLQRPSARSVRSDPRSEVELVLNRGKARLGAGLVLVAAGCTRNARAAEQRAAGPDHQAAGERRHLGQAC